MPNSSFRATIMTTVLLLLTLASTALAGVEFSHSCANYYVGNGISDSTGELFVEAWCHGGKDAAGEERPGRCTRLKLSECFQNSNGELQPLSGNKLPSSRDILDTCDITSCAMRGDPWDGPEMSCYCEDLDGEWDLTSINLDDHVGNSGGYLECGSGDSRRVASTDCLDPSAPASSEDELR